MQRSNLYFLIIIFFVFSIMIFGFYAYTMNKDNKLGMGLGALLSTTNNNSDNNSGFQKINISQIIPNPSHPITK